MDEMQLYEALGLEAPAAGGTPDGAANGQEVAEPATDEHTADDVPAPAEGEDGTEYADSTQDAGQGGENAEGGEPDACDEDKPREMTREERARQAAARRKRETEAAVADALRKQEEKHRAEMDDLIRSLRIEDGNGETVDTREKLEAQLASDRMRDLAEKMNAGTVTADDLTVALSDLVADRARSEAAAREKEAEDARFRAQAEAEIAEISKLDGRVHSISDLLRLEKAQDIYDAVQGGLSYIDAYRKVYAEEITKRAADAARQQAVYEERSKAHLHGTGTSAKGAGRISHEEMELYRFLTPDVTEADIRAHHERYKNR